MCTGEEDSQLVPPTMLDEAVAQAWYRLLRTIGDPVDLCRPAVVSQTQAFLQYAIASPNVIDPCQHPCLQSLPQIFLKAIKGIAGQVDAFLGKCVISKFCNFKNITDGILLCYIYVNYNSHMLLLLRVKMIYNFCTLKVAQNIHTLYLASWVLVARNHKCFRRFTGMLLGRMLRINHHVWIY